MRALDTYRALLRELDKYESPSFSVLDFNYFFPSAENEFIDKRYSEGPDLIQAWHDDLAVLLSDPTSLEFGSGSLADNQAALPSGYRNLLHIEVTVRVDQAKGKYKVGDTLTIYPRKMPSNRKGYIQENAYQRPHLTEAWYRLRGESPTVITIEHDSALSITGGKVEYLKQPNLVYLSPTLQAGEESDDNLNTPMIYPDNTVMKIVKECRRIVLENIESPRYQSNLSEQSIRVN